MLYNGVFYFNSRKIDLYGNDCFQGPILRRDVYFILEVSNHMYNKVGYEKKYLR